MTLEMPAAPPVDKHRRLAALAERGTVDVVILGAGINGAGLFRELTAQGVSCLIVDKGDYGSGTSAAPSRLIHGGLKYLETGEFGLVAQSTLERNLLLRNAPHYVHPLPTLIPIFSWTKGVWAALRTLFGSTSAPRSRGALLIKTGLALYDFYGGRQRVMPRHHMTGRTRSLQETPGLTPAIVATGTYYDALITHPERLVLELIEDGMTLEPQSAAVNHTSLRSARDGVLEFAETDGRTFAVRPRLVVNAAGPWIDQVNQALGMPSRMIGGTKGSHLLLDNDELVRLLDGRMIYFEADDGRICLVYPYLGRALVGSTDIRAGDPDSVACDDAEIDYLIASVAGLLPGVRVGREQIVYAYCGIRPLPASDASNPGLISRDHSAPVLEPAEGRPFPVISLVGGKWTTFRGFAEEVADSILGRFGRTRRAGTREMAIGGGRHYPAGPARAGWIEAAARACGLPRERMAALFERYGTRAAAVAGHIARHGGDAPLRHAPAYSTLEVDFIVRHEHVVGLADIVLRRTTLAIRGEVTSPLLEELALIAGAALAWTPERRNAEVAGLARTLATRHRARLEVGETDGSGAR